MNSRLRRNVVRAAGVPAAGMPVIEAPRPNQVSERSVSNVATVVERLSAPFTTAEILDHAIGLGAVRHCSDIEPILDRLMDTGVIQQIDAAVPLWARASG